RAKEEAYRIASDFVRRGRGGESAKAIAKEVTDAKERSIVAERRAIRAPYAGIGDDLTLFEHLMAMRDGTWSDPFEQHSEYHVLYREAFRAAQPLQKTRAVVHRTLVDDRVGEWLTKVMQNEAHLAKSVDGGG